MWTVVHAATEARSSAATSFSAIFSHPSVTRDAIVRALDCWQRLTPAACAAAANADLRLLRTAAPWHKAAPRLVEPAKAGAGFQRGLNLFSP
jgi:hypothetical protein